VSQVHFSKILCKISTKFVSPEQRVFGACDGAFGLSSAWTAQILAVENAAVSGATDRSVSP
jgi:hypothetical protein